MTWRLRVGYGHRKTKARTIKQKEKAHAKRRAMERYGVELNKDKMRQISELIKSKDSKLVQFVEQGTQKERAIYRVKFQDRWMHVVYDRKRKVPVTFLKPPAKKRRFVATIIRKIILSIRLRRRLRGRAKSYRKFIESC